MRKPLILALLSLLAATGLWSQTTVTGNAIQDSNGNLYATFQDQNNTQHNATVSAFLVSQSGAIPRVSGVPINPALGPFSIDSTGSFSITVTPNASILPSGSQWQFTICGTSVNLGPQPSPLLQVCFNTALITIVSPGPQDITGQANAAAKLLGPKTGSGGGGGSGVVGPGTPGTFAGFVSSNQVGNIDCTFSGITPDRCPNGLNTAGSGDHDEWTVGAGGTIAGKTVCVAANRSVSTCAAGATTGFIGTADSTQAPGSQVSVCWAARCNVYATNNTTTGDWFILSTSVAGGMDDVGTTKPTNTQTFPVDSTVLAGQQALSTFLSPDSLGSMAQGLGTINICGPGLAYYPASGNTINCIPNPTIPASVPQSLVAIPGGTPGYALGGVPINAQTGGSYGWLPTDRLNLITSNNTGAVAWTGPASLANNFTAAFFNINNTGLITFTPLSGQVNGVASQIIPPNWFGFHYTDGANAFMPVLPSFKAFPQCLDSGGNHLNFSNVTGTFICGTSSITATAISTTPNVNTIPSAATYTVLNTDNTWIDKFTGNGATPVTLPQANTLSTAAFIQIPVNNVSFGTCSTCSTSTFSQTAGHTLYATLDYSSATPFVVNSVTDTAGDIFVRTTSDQLLINSSTTNSSVWRADNIAGSGSNAVNFNMSGSVGSTTGNVVEYATTATMDHAGSGIANGSGIASVTIPLQFSNEVAVMHYSGNFGLNNCPPGWTFRGGGTTSRICDRTISFGASSTATTSTGAGVNAALFQAAWGIAGQTQFMAGWYFYVENATSPCSAVTVTPTTSKINTAQQSNLSSYVVPCGKTAAFMSDGTNYEMFGIFDSSIVAGALFANIPACAAAMEGRVLPVTDSTTAVWGNTITGGGANHVQAYCDGTNWTVGAK